MRLKRQKQMLTNLRKPPATMSSSAPEFAYEFNFVGAFSDSVFNACSSATAALKSKVAEASASVEKVMKMNPGINTMSTQVEHSGKLFKVRVQRA